MDRPQRISYAEISQLDDAMTQVLERCAREGTPRPESSAVRAHSPAAFWAFEQAWDGLFRNGVVDHALKELCRIYVSRSVKCEYCGNQRSEGARDLVSEAQVDDLLNFEASDRYSERERAALSYAEAITWRLETDDAFWDRLRRHFNEEELVELACFVALTMGQQSWIRLLNIDHFQVMDQGSVSLAPGLDTAAAIDQARTSDDYWGVK